MAELKCKKCRYFYVTMVGPGGVGYNPYPYCHLYENTGQHPNVLTQECYEPKKRERKVRRDG